MKKKISRALYPYLYIAPVVIFFGFFMAYPIIYSVLISFFNWRGLNTAPFDTFIGLQNFIHLFKDQYFLFAARNTIWFAAGTVIFQNLYGYFLALVIFFGNFKSSTTIRSIIFFPTMLAVVIVALIWRQILNLDGIVNLILGTFGIKGIKWLLDYRISNWVLIFVNIWQWGGYNMVILYAGLQSIDPQLVEAAIIDGAPWSKVVTRIVTPIMKPTIAIALTLTALGGFKVFDLIYVMTRGGPAHTTEVVTTYIYFLAFGEFTIGKYSYAASLVVLFFLVVLFISLLRLRIVSRRN